MTEATSNDRAFIKIAIEKRQLENAIEIAENMLEIWSRMQSGENSISGNSNFSSSSKLSVLANKRDFTDNCEPAMAGYYAFIMGLRTKFSDLDPYIKQSKERLAELQKLFDSYCKGGDIVMNKLSLVKGEIDNKGDE